VIFPNKIIELPSKGLLYPLNHALSSGTIELRLPTAETEEILMSKDYHDNNIIIKKLFESLIVSPFNCSDILIGDRNAIIIAIMVFSYGSMYKLSCSCNCGHSNNINIDLTKIKNKVIDTSIFTPNKNKFEYILPTSKRKIEFSLTTIGTEYLDEHELNFHISKKVTTQLKNNIISIDSTSDREYINNFVEFEMLAIDSLALKKYITQIEPGPVNKMNLECEECTKIYQIILPYGPNFFGITADYGPILHTEIFDLVFHGQGGFTYDAVYNMPIWIRRFYLKKIIDFNKKVNNSASAPATSRSKAPSFRK